MHSTNRTGNAINGQIAEENIIIGQRIETQRNKLGLTQAEIAHYLGLSNYIYVGQFENGTRTVKAKYIIQLSKLFKCSTDYLLGLTDTPSLDTNERIACDYTGLSPKAVNELIEMNHNVELSSCEKQQIKTSLNKLLSDDDISSLYFLLYELNESVNSGLSADNLSCEQSDFREVISNYSAEIDLAQFRLEKTFSKMITRIYGIDDAKKKLSDNYIRIAKEGKDNG